MVIDFVNQLGYPEPVEFVSNIRVNYVYQPWRAILSLINLCLIRKTSGSNKPRRPVLQMLWGIVTSSNLDHVEILWEEFTQGIQTFFLHKACHKASLKDPKKKPTHLIIPYGRTRRRLHKRVKAKQLEPATKRAPAKRPTSTKPTPAKQPKSPKNKPSKRIPTRKVRKGKIQFDLVDEEEDMQQETEPQGEGDDPVLKLAKKLSLDSLQEKGEGEGADADFERAMKMNVEGKGKAIVIEEQVAHSLIDLSKKKSTTDQFILQRHDQAPHDLTTGPSSQPQDDTSEKIVDKERGEEASTTVTSEQRMAVHVEDQAGSDLGKGNESIEDQAGPDPGESHAALADQSLSPHYDSSYGLP
ncbi:hypothetical protein Tco_0989180 [Tanacetum coccineum]|uniref:Uncharacterized protein n=1 Tax=Tanacetum coccineum TaxID=301880 RepID=A0ABQ5ESX4_9ASTR